MMQKRLSFVFVLLCLTIPIIFTGCDDENTEYVLKQYHYQDTEPQTAPWYDSIDHGVSLQNTNESSHQEGKEDKTSHESSHKEEEPRGKRSDGRLTRKKRRVGVSSILTRREMVM